MIRMFISTFKCYKAFRAVIIGRYKGHVHGYSDDDDYDDYDYDDDDDDKKERESEFSY